MKKSKAILALAMAFLMFAFSGCSKENKEKENTAPVSSGDYSLIKSVTTYNMDVQTGEWVAASKTEFQYENNYPVSMDFDDYNAEAQSKKKFEYSFTSDLKPISMKQYNEKGEIEKTVDYTEGKISDIYDYSDGGMHTQRTMLQYGNNDDYFTLLVSSSKFTPNDTESVSLL